MMKISQYGYRQLDDGRFEHRIVMEEILGRELLPSEVVHHKDGNKVNNDPANLEVLARADHSKEHAIVKRGWARSGWRGVVIDKQGSPFRALIMCEGKSLSIGRFRSAREAALAWNDAALEIYGPKFPLFNQVFVQ